MQSPQLTELPVPPPGKAGWPWTQERPPLSNSQTLPKLTVVTPSFNQGQFIEETIRSVLLQGYPNLEYVVVDGGSTDESVEIIKRYEPWLHRWVSEPDRGQSHAINKGWSYSTGDVCAWLNSDDVYLPGTLEVAASAFINNSDADLVYGDMLFINQQSTVEGFHNSPDFSLAELVRTNFIPQPSTFVRRGALDKVGDLDESLHLCMDYDLWLRVAHAGQGTHVNKLLSALRIHPDTKTSTQMVRMTKELADLAIRFVERTDTPLDRANGKALVAQPAWIAGTMLWFSGNREQAKQYIELALRDLSLVESEELAVCVARAAVESEERNSVAKVREFFEAFSTLNSIANMSEGWASVLEACESSASPHFYQGVLRGIKRAPTRRLLRTVAPTVLKQLTGTSLLASLRQVKRRITHSPVGMSLSELS